MCVLRQNTPKQHEIYFSIDDLVLVLNGYQNLKMLNLPFTYVYFMQRSLVSTGLVKHSSASW